MKQERLYFIGPLGGGQTPTNGASLKNWHLTNRLKNLPISLSCIDTEHWKKNPTILLRIFLLLLFHPCGRFILSLNTISSYRLIKAINLIPGRRHLFYWVIGGSLGQRMMKGIVNSKAYKDVKLFIVEGNDMKRELEACGYTNVIVVPNFKKIDYIPHKVPTDKNRKLRFVFLSRIIEAKGCGYIINAAELLNKKYANRFEVDFYGPIDRSYTAFTELISGFANVNYKGFLDLRESRNYDVLASYDVMLFPTYWQGEGFPGVVIDAFVSGIPVIASDWHFNKDIIVEGHTGVVIPPKDTEALYHAMERIILHSEILGNMSDSCQQEAKKYSVDNIITMDFLKKNSII